VRVAIFCHSLRSDWNHGNAHFLRGIAAELAARGHEVTAWEPDDAWSVAQLVADDGPAALEAWREAYPSLHSRTYTPRLVDLDVLLDGVDLALVHEWNPPEIIEAIGRRRAGQGRFLALFHDTHHRCVSSAEDLARRPLDGYDGVLAFGEVISETYRRAGWHRRVWTWHEAADTRIFHPRPRTTPAEDVVWIGNWGDDERTAELSTYLLAPARQLGLRGTVHGVRYPPEGIAAVRRAGLAFRGRLANHRVPQACARHRFTVHVPRRPYVTSLPGIPTIRVFEALACGIPLISAPWDDCEHLFAPGEDYLVASSGAEMARHMRAVLTDESLAACLRSRGPATIAARHTCKHRVSDLLRIVTMLQDGDESEVA
jgi:spore maturation protein CgeB